MDVLISPFAIGMIARFEGERGRTGERIEKEGEGDLAENIRYLTEKLIS